MSLKPSPENYTMYEVYITVYTENAAEGRLSERQDFDIEFILSMQPEAPQI